MEHVPGVRLASSSEDKGVAQVADRDAQVAHAHGKVALLVCKLAVCKAQIFRCTRHLLRCAGSFNSLLVHKQVETMSAA